jgi:hypothetical protein
MAILAISHVMKSITYKHQIHRFRVFRQSLRITQLWQFYRYQRNITKISRIDIYRFVGEIQEFETANSFLIKQMVSELLDFSIK